MKAFFKKVAEVKKDMETIKRNMTTMDKKHGAALTAVSNSASVPPREAQLHPWFCRLPVLKFIRGKVTDFGER